jgi:hypothetical protein
MIAVGHRAHRLAFAMLRIETMILRRFLRRIDVGFPFSLNRSRRLSQYLGFGHRSASVPAVQKYRTLQRSSDAAIEPVPLLDTGTRGPARAALTRR